MTRRPRLLVVSDAVVPTGFARLAASLLSRLTTSFDCFQIGTNYAGPPLQNPWPVVPVVRAPEVHEAPGVDEVVQAISTVAPDLMLFINDLGVIGQYCEALQEIPRTARFLAYFPVDNDPLEPEL